MGPTLKAACSLPLEEPGKGVRLWRTGASCSQGRIEGPGDVQPDKRGVADGHWDERRDVTIAFTLPRARREGIAVLCLAPAHSPPPCLPAAGAEKPGAWDSGRPKL